MTPQACERELDRLYRRHECEVRRYVAAALRDRNEVEDVVQQTFLKALRALHAGVQVERPRRWLVAIARNECRQHFRAAARRLAHVRLDEAAAVAPAEDGPTASELREAFAQLAPNQRSALVRRELEGRSYEEIAATLGLTESAVETLLFRARHALREQLEQDGGCDDARALLAADVLTGAQRRRLRAHVRSCAACGTLERRRRGRLAAARRLASLFPVPSWLGSLVGGAGGKAAAVAVATALAAGGVADVAHTGKSQPPPRPAPQLVHRDAVRLPVAEAPVTRAPAPAKAKPPRRAVEPPKPKRAVVAAAPAEPAHEAPRTHAASTPAPSQPLAAERRAPVRPDAGPDAKKAAPTKAEPPRAAPVAVLPELQAQVSQLPAQLPQVTVNPPPLPAPLPSLPSATVTPPALPQLPLPDLPKLQELR